MRYMTQTYHLNNWYIIQTLIPEVTITNYLTNHFTTTHENILFLCTYSQYLEQFTK